MIVVRITLDALPEKHLEITQTLLSLIKPIEKESGCLRYSVFCDIIAKNSFSLLEEWATRNDLDHHMMSEEFTVLLGTKMLLSKPIGIRIYTVSQSEGMEAVMNLRNRNKGVLL